LGRTDHLLVKRCSFFPKEDILADLSNVVAQSEADYITFVGDGEPTLNQDLDWLIRKTKELWKVPVAVITNGSLLFLKEVRSALNAADVVLPTLDAGTEEIFKLINRPHPQIKFAEMIDGLINFRQQYAGHLWLEIMLVKGLNDHSEALRNIRQAVDLIRPDGVYVSIPIRPPAEKWVEPPEPEKVLAAQQILGKVEYIIEKETGDFGISEFKDAHEAILETAYRHPLREVQALTIEKRFQQAGTLQNMIAAQEVFKYDYRNDIYILPRKLLRGIVKSH